MSATITGCGVAVFEGRLPNADLEARLTTDDALIGEVAGAAVLSRAPAGRGLLGRDFGCDGSLTSLVEVPAGGSRRPTSAASVADGSHWLRMEGPELFRQAVRAVVDTASAVLARAETAATAVDLFVPHQANARIVVAAAARSTPRSRPSRARGPPSRCWSTRPVSRVTACSCA